MILIGSSENWPYIRKDVTSVDHIIKEFQELIMAPWLYSSQTPTPWTRTPSSLIPIPPRMSPTRNRQELITATAGPSTPTQTAFFRAEQNHGKYDRRKFNPETLGYWSFHCFVLPCVNLAILREKEGSKSIKSIYEAAARMNFKVHVSSSHLCII